MSGHARYSPSAISRTLACSGSTTLAKAVGGSSNAADEGTHFHAYCEKLCLAEPIVPDDYTWLGEVRQDFKDMGAIYADFMLSLVDGDYWAIEQKLKFSDSLWGTSDAVVVKDGVLYIIDIKFGFVRVYPDCDQLKTYAFMALKELYHLYNIKEVRTIIYQPRVTLDFQVATFEPTELFQYRNMVVEKLKKIDEGQTEFHAGPHCKYCNKLACPEIQRIKSGTDINPESMTIDELSVALDELEGLEHYIKEVRDFAYKQANNGHKIKGRKLVRKVTHRKFAKNIPIEKLVEYIPRDKLFTEKMITPTQAFKINKDLPAEFVEKPEGGLTLVLEGDKRNEIIPSCAIEDMISVLSV